MVQQCRVRRRVLIVDTAPSAAFADVWWLKIRGKGFPKTFKKEVRSHMVLNHAMFHLMENLGI